MKFIVYTFMCILLILSVVISWFIFSSNKIKENNSQTESLYGQIDSANCTNIKGWAWNPNQPGATVKISIFIDKTNTDSTPFKEIIADEKTETVALGFTFNELNSIRDNKDHKIYFYASDFSNNSKKILLENSPSILKCPIEYR